MSPSPIAGARRGEAIAGRALGDRAVERVARAGILSRAVNYIVLAALVTAVLLGRGNKELDRRGAIESVSGGVAGHVMLVLLCIGFVSYIAWQLLRAATRRSDQSSLANAGRRLLALGTALVYVGFLVTTVRVLAGAGTTSPQSDQDSWTARLLGASGGRVVVVLAGIAVIIVGLVLFGYAASRKFESPLDTGAMSPAMRRVAEVLGVVGQSARGLVFGIVGGFVLSAGLANDASRSKGLDASLRTLAAQRFGAILLSVVALGFLAFGLYSLVDARYRDDFSR
jgi:hypothetical protein